jgi:hypothetical protein
MRHKGAALAGFVTGVVAGAIAHQRSAGSQRERLELYFDDGSFVTLADGSPDAARLLPLAHQVLIATRPG